jgi:hypothetical protein
MSLPLVQVGVGMVGAVGVVGVSQEGEHVKGVEGLFLKLHSRGRGVKRRGRGGGQQGRTGCKTLSLMTANTMGCEQVLRGEGAS